MKLLGLLLLVFTFMALAFADEKDCIARGQKCVGENKPCCKGTTCMYYANRCVGV
uniref:U-reduvitoxin-Pr1a n=1 Tax=Platymeris rhadamanthus TaxID=1134088 RepID=PLK1A_PLARH|nr:RecName: Full=U-reduvitoxin-Pr1a; Short=U-RDTX-Pr1a; Flags: Precursor [Platymeris rhadamanthus]QHB21534.1 venom Ptu1 family peptide Pr1a [Platymeris rhadamanthus]